MRNLALFMTGVTLIGAPLAAQTTPEAAAAPQPAAAAPAAAPNVTVGASVSDATGGQVGTVESVANGTAVVNTGTAKAGVALGSFAQGPNGLVIGMTKAQIEAAVAQAKPAEVAVGADVFGSGGVKIGKVEAVSGALVTVAGTGVKAQLPRTAFGQGPSGLAIGMTASEFEAAAKAAGGATKTGGR